MAEKKERKNTPVGIAKWAHIQTPKKGFNDGDKQKYSIDIVFDPAADEAWREFARALQALEKSKECKNSTIRFDVDDKKEKTGKFVVSFKTSDKFKPPVYDHRGHLLPPDVLVGNGSKVRVNYSENYYKGFGGGINLYLNAVQVVELVEYSTKSATAFGFDVEPDGANEAPPPF